MTEGLTIKGTHVKEYTVMTKKELLEVVATLNIDEKLAELGADTSKITNSNLIELIEANKPAIEVKKKVVSKGKKMDTTDIKLFYNTSLPFIVLDHDKSYTITDDQANRTIEVSWGNPVIGKTREQVVLNGEMQYLSRGLVMAMKEMTIPDVKINKDTGALTAAKPRKRFTLTKVEGHTPAQVEAIVQKQRGLIGQR